MKNTPLELDKIADVCLNYRPKSRAKKAKRRGSFLEVYNIVTPYATIQSAKLTENAPGIDFQPEDPGKSEDISASKKSVHAVPHSEIKKRIEEHRKQSALNPNRRGPKRKSSASRARSH